MNYRHAFHAGNFADVLKHAVLAQCLAALNRKEQPWRVIDTHAGPGLYDLAGDKARRTGEAGDGIGKLSQEGPPALEALLAPYRAVLAEARTRYGETIYPGSPAIARLMMRPQDRAIFCEKHPEEVLALTRYARNDPRVKVVELDGWTGLKANLPPKERRGLVVIDPPFEAADEMERLPGLLEAAWRKWQTGQFLVWYPIKDLRRTDAFYRAMTATGIQKMLRVELAIDNPARAEGMVGTGLVLINPPWPIEDTLKAALPALLKLLQRNDDGFWRCDWLIPEKST
jgi:23S rRNA (adenine2030-N6)-methyltransferase